MINFSLDESGLFSAASYDEAARTLKVQFRTTGDSYEVRGVSKELGERFMSQSGKSGLWHAELKGLGPVKL